MERKPKLVLFVCVGNSCRSQMAEGFGNHYGQGKVVAFSAGTMPSGRVHPLAIEAMREVGIDITRQTSKGVWEFDITQFDAVVSLCDARTDELCPATTWAFRNTGTSPTLWGCRWKSFGACGR